MVLMPYPPEQYACTRVAPKELVEGVPKPVKEGVPQAEADDLKKQLEDVGASVEIK